MTATILAVLLVATTAAAAPETATDAGDATTVYVSANGSAYHHAACPRLRFARTMPLGEARLEHQPCAVCMRAGWTPPAAAPLAAAAAVPAATAVPPAGSMPTPASAPPAPAAGTPVTQTSSVPVQPAPPLPGRRGGHGRAVHAAIGAAIGFGAGFVLGYATSDVDDFIFTRTQASLFVGGLGAGVGALIGALVPDRSEETAERALAEGRDAIRRARLERDVVPAAALALPARR